MIHKTILRATKAVKLVALAIVMTFSYGNVSAQSSAPVKLKVVSASCAHCLAPQGGNTYGAWNMVDGNPATVWAVSLNDPSVRSYDDDRNCIYGPWFELQCKKLSHIIIRNGYGKSASSFANNSRASHVAFEIEANGMLEWFKTPLKDDPAPQRLNVPLKIEDGNNIVVHLVFDYHGNGIIKGAKWNDLCISEIEFWGWK